MRPQRTRKPSRAALEAAKNAEADLSSSEDEYSPPRTPPKRARASPTVAKAKRTAAKPPVAKTAKRRRVRGKWQPPQSPIAPTPAQLRPVLAYLDHGSVMQLAATCHDSAAAVYQGHGAATHGQHPAAVAYGEWVGSLEGWDEAQCDEMGSMWLSVTDDPLRWFALQQRVLRDGLDLGGIVLCNECGCFQFSGNPCYFCENDIEKEHRVTKGHAKKMFKLRDQDLRGLDVQLRRNPRYRSAAPMQLYLPTQLNEASERRWGGMAELIEKKIRAGEAKKAKLERVDSRLRAEGKDPAEVHAAEAAQKRRNIQAAAAGRRFWDYDGGNSSEGYSSEDYDNPVCWECGAVGHKRYECRYR